VRLLRRDRLNGRTTGPARLTGGELQILQAPAGHQVLTAPAVWHQGAQTWMFIGNYAATAGYRLLPGSKPRLRRVWQVPNGGSSPVVAGGLLYVFDPLDGGLHVYRPPTGALVTTLPTGTGHWTPRTGAAGRLAAPEGSPNDTGGRSVRDTFRLP